MSIAKKALFWAGYFIVVGLISTTTGIIGGMMAIGLSPWIGKLGLLVGFLMAAVPYFWFLVAFPIFQFYLDTQPWVSRVEFYTGEGICGLDEEWAFLISVTTPGLVWAILYGWLL
ncbi:MAG: hypothetical protein HY559_06230 [Gammaproteobacteria bacterium]|nr:hypothetical protein [Gammaproteobacteria bacterium]